jgi:Aspartyl protease/Dockerin type I domain
MIDQGLAKAGTILALAFTLCLGDRAVGGDAPLGGFIPFVGIAETKEAKSFNSDTFFIADVENTPTAPYLGVGASTYYDIAILDTGSAGHVLSHDAAVGFDINGEGFAGTESQQIGTASGLIDLAINLPHGIYAAGLKNRMSAGSSLVMNNAALKGQTSVSDMSAPTAWKLPSIVGLPMAAQHAVAILNSQPQVFTYQGRTLRTPQVELRDIGSGGGGIIRRAPLLLNPGDGFIAGPLFQFTVNGQLDIVPTSPTVVPNAGLFLEVDMADGSKHFDDKQLLLDTGADVTVLSQVTAKRLGFDALTDKPDFVLQVEDPSGVTSGVPGIYVDELNIDTVGGNFTLHNVPVAVFDLPDPTRPGNVLPGLIGTHLFSGRDIVIDAEPAIGQGGVGPSLYISDPVSITHTWISTVPQTNINQSNGWLAAGTPDVMWDAQLINSQVSTQFVSVQAPTTVYRITVGAPGGRRLQLQLNGQTLTSYGEVALEAGGEILLLGGKLDAGVVNIDDGLLSGSGTIEVGSGPVQGVVRNLGGRVSPGTTGATGQLTINGDFSNLVDGTFAVDIRGLTAGGQYDQLIVGRSAFLGGTLNVVVPGPFAPSVGNIFTILMAGQSVIGTFDSLVLPGAYTWNVTYNATNVLLTVTGVVFPGDYNHNGVVDAADYTVWRDTMGSTTKLAADGNGNGMIDSDDYTFWKNRFGMMGAGAGRGNSGSVPEPATFTLLATAAAIFGCQRRIKPRG